jgi:hypothetical protein
VLLQLDEVQLQQLDVLQLEQLSRFGTVPPQVADALARQRFGHVREVGLELYLRYGPEVVSAVRGASGVRVFLDLKLHDIPATVAGAARSVAGLRPVAAACGNELEVVFLLEFLAELLVVSHPFPLRSEHGPGSRTGVPGL